MYISALALLLCIGYFSQETNGHAQDFDVNRFISDVNSSSVNRNDLDKFFQSNALSRCEFTRKMIPTYSGDTTLISALYDVMQSDDVSSLTRGEFAQALLQQSAGLTAEQFKENVQKVLKEVHDINIKPFEFTEGTGMFAFDSFKAELWADDVDTNNDDMISEEEISRWMRATLDADDNALLERCEFVEAMRRFSQHPATAAKMYDVIFRARDHVWADVDSNFLAIQISRKDSPTISTREFVQFFTYENELASGAVVVQAGTATRVDGNGATTRFMSLTTAALCLLIVLPLGVMGQ